jgi:hypothetical protein
MPNPGILYAKDRFKWFNKAFQWGAPILLGVFLWMELERRENLPILWQAFKRHCAEGQLGWLCLLFCLLPLNWLLETAKWRYFLLRQAPISWWTAYKAVLAGVAFALFTPNRVGEFAGRLLFIQQPYQWQAFAANLLGSIAQYLVLLGAGMLGAWHFYSDQWTEVFVGPLLPFVMLGAWLVLLVVFLQIHQFTPILKRLTNWKYLLRARPAVKVFEQTSHFDATWMLVLSGCRYAVYTIQYIAILYFFKAPVDFFTAFSGVATIFLLQTIVPLPAIASILLRGNLAVFIWSQAGVNEISALASTFVLWVVNLILPAFIGTFFLFNVRITKALGYED